jgi:hypothetical protein
MNEDFDWNDGFRNKLFPYEGYKDAI